MTHADEFAAVEFMEAMRWKGEPSCPHCGCFGAKQMHDRATGERNKRFLWRCDECKKQFTVRVGTVLEDSRIPLRHWCYAFWMASSSKKGVSALQIKRHTGLSYKSALFLMHRIRYAMAAPPADSRPLSGIVEADETYVGGKPRNPIPGAHGLRGEAMTHADAIREAERRVIDAAKRAVNGWWHQNDSWEAASESADANNELDASVKALLALEAK